ncbi:MAG: DUF86 domain-containing protein [Imperialibacter sp.]|uniref:HepT-like ribonuclease domain-containing protein n=1 Tax=Imperialibacter sp. TaxID=2038411 RepID=UPI0032ED96E8
MTEREKKFLSDIFKSILLIEQSTIDVASFAAYEKDTRTRAAVERHLGIIGEAVNKFLKESGNNEINHAHQIISMRNRIIHAYDDIDDSIIWSIVTRHLPLLKKEIDGKLGGD